MGTKTLQSVLVALLAIGLVAGPATAAATVAAPGAVRPTG